MPPPAMHTEHSGANSPTVFTSKHVSVQAGKGNVHFKNRGRRSIFVEHKMTIQNVCCARKFKKALINGISSDIMILYSVASPPLTLPTYLFSHYVMCIAGCVVRRHREATLSRACAKLFGRDAEAHYRPDTPPSDHVSSRP